MKTKLKTDGETTAFIIRELEPEYHDIALGLFYLPFEDGFAKQFPSDTPHLEQIYRNFERYAEEVILQTARLRPVPWEKALTDILKIIESVSVQWRIAGSLGLALRGIDVAPRDIDLVVDNASAQKLGQLLLGYLIEPVVDTTGWIANWFGRAFLHARVEWIGVDDPCDLEGLEVVNWKGSAIKVPPLEMHLAEDEHRGLTERAAKIQRYMKERQR